MYSRLQKYPTQLHTATIKATDLKLLNTSVHCTFSHYVNIIYKSFVCKIYKMKYAENNKESFKNLIVVLLGWQFIKKIEDVMQNIVHKTRNSWHKKYIKKKRRKCWISRVMGIMFFKSLIFSSFQRREFV